MIHFYVFYDCLDGLHGGAAGSPVSLQQEGPVCESRPCFFLQVLLVHAWVSSWYSGFLPLSKNMTVKLTGLSKFLKCYVHSNSTPFREYFLE